MFAEVERSSVCRGTKISILFFQKNIVVDESRACQKVARIFYVSVKYNPSLFIALKHLSA